MNRINKSRANCINPGGKAHRRLMLPVLAEPPLRTREYPANIGEVDRQAFIRNLVGTARPNGYKVVFVPFSGGTPTHILAPV